MSDEVTPMYPTLFSSVQDYVVERLNSDYQLSAVGLEFIPEHIRDVEYLIKRSLGRQGMVGIVNTVKAQYGGTDGETQAWQMEVECDILENPPIRKAWMKQNNLSAGTVVDCCNFVNESLAGPYSPTYGQFCSKSVEVGEDSGIVVGKCLFDTYCLGEISGAISGESHYVIKWATKDELSALSAETWAAIEEISAELSGSEEMWNAIEELSSEVSSLYDEIQEIDEDLSDKISYPVMEQNPYGSNEWVLDPSPLDPSTPGTAKVKFGAYEESVPGLYTPYIKLGDNPRITIDQNHIWLGRTELVNFPDMSAAISALDADHFIRWFATPSQPNRWIVNFGRSSTGGISFVSDSDHPTQSYIDIAGNLITAPGYDPDLSTRSSTRGLMKSRAGEEEEEDNHLQYNQKGLAFVEEVSSVSQDVQDLSAETPSIWRVWEYDPGYVTFTALISNVSVGSAVVGTPPQVSLEYSIDEGATWSDFIVGQTWVQLQSKGDKVYLRAKTTNGAFASSASNYISFRATRIFALSGNLAYLLDKDGEVGTMPEWAFHRLFSYCQDTLRDASKLVLPWDVVAERGYEMMFAADDALSAAPNIPASSLGTRACANMFEGCTSLVNPPDVAATTVGISSLNRMFYNCTSLQSSPHLKPTTLESSCYRGMFRGCASLNSIKLDYTGDFSGSGFNTSPFDDWVNGVPSAGTFYYNGSDTTRGISAIPDGWTVQTF